MFAPLLSKPERKTSDMSSNRSTRSPIRSTATANAGSSTAGAVPALSWNFAGIPTLFRSHDGKKERSVVQQHRHPFFATFAVQQNDAMSDSHRSGARSPADSGKAPLSAPERFKLPTREGETVSIPEGILSSIHGEHTDAISSQLRYVSSITQTGPAPPEFGLTQYLFTPENFSITHQAASAGTPAGSGSAGTPATPATYIVTGDIRNTITFQVAGHSRANIASKDAPAITQTNYPKVVSDLTPSAAAHGGLMKNQPPRTQFWAEDLTIRHERFHCAEDQRFGGPAVSAAQAWFNRQTANSGDQLLDAARGIMPQISAEMAKQRGAPADEERAYDDGAPLYAARAQAIKAKGDAHGYVPQPPTQSPKQTGPVPGGAQSPGQQHTPPTRPSK